MSAIHPSIVSRACETLLSHPQCPPIGDQVEGTAGLAEAMEAALEAVREDLADDCEDPPVRTVATAILRRGHREGCDFILLGEHCSCEVRLARIIVDAVRGRAS